MTIDEHGEPTGRGSSEGSGDRKDGWEDHRGREVRLSLQATPAERLAWLEEALELSRRRGALPGRC